MEIATVYGQDLKPTNAGAVSASLNLVRCLFGAVGSGVVQIIYKRIGAGWAMVLFSGVIVLGSPLPVIVVRYGRSWRMKRDGG